MLESSDLERPPRASDNRSRRARRHSSGRGAAGTSCGIIMTSVDGEAGSEEWSCFQKTTVKYQSCCQLDPSAGWRMRSQSAWWSGSRHCTHLERWH